jgi:hypothetical protein
VLSYALIRLQLWYLYFSDLTATPKEQHKVQRAKDLIQGLCRYQLGQRRKSGPRQLTKYQPMHHFLATKDPCLSINQFRRCPQMTTCMYSNFRDTDNFWMLQCRVRTYDLSCLSIYRELQDGGALSALPTQIRYISLITHREACILQTCRRSYPNDADLPAVGQLVYCWYQHGAPPAIPPHNR